VTRIAVSILAADFSRLGEELRAVEAAGADWIHVDVMDGHFVPNITIGPPVVEAIKKGTTLPLDVHLMISNPERYVTDFAHAGADYLSVHREACPHLHAVVQQIRKLGVRPAVAVNPGTALASVEPILADVEMLLIMSVNPGFGGQTFIESALAKIEAAARFKCERGLGFQIEVDGGVKVHNAARTVKAGAEVLVIGTGIFGEPDEDPHGGRTARRYDGVVGRIRGAVGAQAGT
jgi:ribulose-phosphate 3-epimerase